MWTDAVYQWRANEKRCCVFDLVKELRLLNQVMAHSKYNEEWRLWFCVSKLSCRWVAGARRRRRFLYGTELLVEYSKYYAGAPYNQDSSDPAKIKRDKDHRSSMQELRKSRYKNDLTLKLKYRQHYVLATSTAYYVPVTDEEGWVTKVKKVVKGCG